MGSTDGSPTWRKLISSPVLGGFQGLLTCSRRLSRSGGDHRGGITGESSPGENHREEIT